MFGGRREPIVLSLGTVRPSWTKSLVLVLSSVRLWIPKLFNRICFHIFFSAVFVLRARGYAVYLTLTHLKPTMFTHRTWDFLYNLVLSCSIDNTSYSVFTYASVFWIARLTCNSQGPILVVNFTTLESYGSIRVSLFVWNVSKQQFELLDILACLQRSWASYSRVTKSNPSMFSRSAQCSRSWLFTVQVLQSVSRYVYDNHGIDKFIASSNFPSTWCNFVVSDGESFRV